jgi:mono/diheme cytochrome c family protein
MARLRQHLSSATRFNHDHAYDQEQEALNRPEADMPTAVQAFLRVCCLASLAMTAVIATIGLATAQDFTPDAGRGKGLYQRHCLTCHGSRGAGDGPDAAALKMPPSNFHDFKSYVKSDEELLRTIEQGVVFSPMHSWQGRLTETERQDVLAYIRLLVQQGR